MSELIIPTGIEELDSGWLTRALRSRGSLPTKARVGSVRAQPLGEGEGFVGVVARLHLDYEGESGDLPPTMIAKLPTPVARNRAMGELLGAYEREIFVYEQLGEGLPVRIPRCFYSDFDPNSTSAYEAEGAAIMDRLPRFLLGSMMAVARFIAGRRNRRYVLLIEDLSHDGEVGDQIEGCGPERCAQIVRSIARVHAQHWESPALSDYYWLRRMDINPRTLHNVYLKNSKPFKKKRGGGPMKGLLDWLDVHAADLIARYAADAPQTLQHADLRLDNVFFFPEAVGCRASGGDEPIALFDWQLASRGPGTYDVAYFLSCALVADVDIATCRELVAEYHGELKRSGVDDYPFEQCHRDYLRALPIVLHRLASTTAMELGEDRGARMVDLWADRTLARLEGTSPSDLL